MSYLQKTGPTLICDWGSHNHSLHRVSPKEQHILDTLHRGTAAEVRALRDPKSGGQLHIVYCETSGGGTHFRISGMQSDFLVRASGRSPRPAWVETLGSDFVTEVSCA